MSGTRISIVQNINQLKKTKFCEILSDCKNINQPLVVRILVREENTSIKYDWEDPSDRGLNPYRGGYFILEVFFGVTFPYKVPTVIFKTPIVHANVSEKDGYICLTALNEWNPDSDNLTDNVITPIINMLNNPSFEDKLHDEKNVPFKN